MKWKIECQSCQRAKCYGYGMCFACDETECKYKPYVSTASATLQQTQANSIELCEQSVDDK